MAILNKTEGICQEYTRLYACAKRIGKIGGENGGAMLIGFGFIFTPQGWCYSYNGGSTTMSVLMQYLNALRNACYQDRRLASLGY